MKNECKNEKQRNTENNNGIKKLTGIVFVKKNGVLIDLGVSMNCYMQLGVSMVCAMIQKTF